MATDTRHTHYSDIAAFVTKDGSIIRELMHPNTHAARQQSLAEATVPVGTTTRLHRHGKTEELYHITHGRGEMRLGENRFEVTIGDSICIPPGTPHNIRNTGDTNLRILCTCSPAYAHDDTELLD